MSPATAKEPLAPEEHGARTGPGVLRRNAAPLLAAFGAFFITFALLLRFFLYGQIAVIPADMRMELRLTDEAATYLDTSTWKTVEDAEVVRSIGVRGTASPGKPEWGAWDMSIDTATREHMIEHMDRRVIVDRSTGTAVNCCGEHVNGDRAVRQAGLVLSWPANATKDEYAFYDADIRAAPRMVFDGTENIGGVATRKFVQRISPTQVPQSSREAPAKALGLDRDGTVDATRWVEVERTYWIEPVSGNVVNAAEKRTETLRSDSGRGERVLLDADLALQDTQVAAYTDNARSTRALLIAVQTHLPVSLGALGTVLLLAALITSARNRRAPQRAPTT
ncbi:DUF3068 domain-containing protein [Nocardiopsis gilva YIM 90087]|uniref:DUF3068 domain-containing protein n=1 Tax=Nocardiopsis gilva YIM 90087 TaxID=1235441 RepID=A0A223SB92_9ACTN|nr:DUF3068 domain-containing protein [Nocardiopsis gilva]ASU85434.1 DUF3068 domain-containing protein [Nocardiopsis gilva YIM 90087]